jgi:hypothetical protein
MKIKKRAVHSPKDDVVPALIRMLDGEPLSTELKRRCRAWLEQQSRKRGRPTKHGLITQVQDEYWRLAIPARYCGQTSKPIIAHLQTKFGLSRSRVFAILKVFVPDAEDLV